MDTKNYKFYKAQDFAKDENFQEWVLKPDLKSNSFWKNWILRNPELQPVISEAISLVRSIQFHSYKLSGAEIEMMWANIWHKVSIEDEKNEVPESLIKKHPWMNIWKYVAAILIASFAVVGVWRTTESQPEKTVSLKVETNSAEVEKIVLPDSSDVVLNANSKILYSENGNTREVWLKGEAYFHVKHTKDEKVFIVRTYGGLSVKVLGTRFDMNTFGEKISVVLQEGSIALTISDSVKNQTQLFLKPGEILNYNKLTGDYSKSKMEAASMVSWTKGQLTLDHYSLKDAKSFMQNVFGIELIIRDSSLLKSCISGSMPIVYHADTMKLQFEKAFQLRFLGRGNVIRVEK